MVKRRVLLEKARKYAVQYMRAALPADPESLIGKAVEFVVSDEYLDMILKELGVCAPKHLDGFVNIEGCYADLIRTLTDDVQFICRHRRLPIEFEFSKYPDFIRRPIRSRDEAMKLEAANNDEIADIVGRTADKIQKDFPEFPDIRSDAVAYSNHAVTQILMFTELSPIDALERDLYGELVLYLFDY